MFSRTTPRRLTRVAMAGALAAVPLTALAIPASADPATSEPGVTEVRHPHTNDWDCDRPGFFDDWDHSPGRWDDCDLPGRWNDPWRLPRHLFPRGTFGSS
ncbi:hypothetical protein ACQPXH_09820 [Nocardia sp. CA-135953]|uniref:hypothetical protein n=1 Tax=Nocardia sp. CA-135953 TaxID=3239978 RepID=UPI003D98D6A9